MDLIQEDPPTKVAQSEVRTWLDLVRGHPCGTWYMLECKTQSVASQRASAIRHAKKFGARAGEFEAKSSGNKLYVRMLTVLIVLLSMACAGPTWQKTDQPARALGAPYDTTLNQEWVSMQLHCARETRHITGNTTLREARIEQCMADNGWVRK